MLDLDAGSKVDQSSHSSRMHMMELSTLRLRVRGGRSVAYMVADHLLPISVHGISENMETETMDYLVGDDLAVEE